MDENYFDEGTKDSFEEAKSPSNATAELTAVSETESTLDDEGSVRQLQTEHRSSTQVITRQKRLIGKLQMEISVLEESLIAAKSKDIQLMQRQMEELQLDLRRVRSLNRELRGRVDHLERLRWSRSVAEPRPTPVSYRVETEDERIEQVPTEARSARERRPSGIEEKADIPSTFDEVMKTLPPTHRQIIRSHVSTEVDSLRRADLKVIRELSAQLAEAQKRVAVSSLPAPHRTHHERDPKRINSLRDEGIMTEPENALSLDNSTLRWALGAISIVLFSALLTAWGAKYVYR